MSNYLDSVLDTFDTTTFKRQFYRLCCMVAKLIIKEGMGKKDIELPRILYTGTTRKYIVDVVNRWGNFEHMAGSFIHLDNSPSTAIYYALKRATFYKDLSVVLIVDSEKLQGELYYDGVYKTYSLNAGSFLTYEFSLNETGRFKEDDYYKILEIGKQIVELSELELRQSLFRYIGF